MKLKKKHNYVGVLSSVFAIFIGLIVGLVVLLLCNPNQAFPGFFTKNIAILPKYVKIEVCSLHTVNVSVEYGGSTNGLQAAISHPYFA